MKTRSKLKLSIRTRTFSSFCAMGAAYEQIKAICKEMRPLLITFDLKFLFLKFIYEDVAKTR